MVRLPVILNRAGQPISIILKIEGYNLFLSVAPLTFGLVWCDRRVVHIMKKLDVTILVGLLKCVTGYKLVLGEVQFREPCLILLRRRLLGINLLKAAFSLHTILLRSLEDRQDFHESQSLTGRFSDWLGLVRAT